MPLQHRAFQIPKDPARPEENQDAWAVDDTRALAVVADGVASAIFSKQWAEVLTEAVIHRPPVPEQPEFADWLAACRKRWDETIDTTGLAWFQKAKLPNGAFSTLVWAQVAPAEPGSGAGFGAQRLYARAIGDSCLLHIRHGELLRSFPVESAAEFETNPMALGSVDLGRDEALDFATLDVHCYIDDTIILCSDAVAEWLYRGIESGSSPSWEKLWEMDEQQWFRHVDGLRQQRHMRYDDATLLLLRVVKEPEPEPPAEPQPVTSQPTTQPEPQQPSATSSESTSAAGAGTQPASLEAQPADGSSAPEEQTRSQDLQTGPKPAIDQIAEGIDRIADDALRTGRKLWEQLRKPRK